MAKGRGGKDDFAILYEFILKAPAFNNITKNISTQTQDKLNNLPKKSLNHLTPNELWITTIASDFVALQT